MKSNVIRPRQVALDWIDDGFAAPDPWAEPGKDCPDLDRLRAAAAAELPLDERQNVLDHTLRCRYCADSWRLALQLGARPKISLAAQFLSILWADLHFVTSLPRRLARSRAGRAAAGWLDLTPFGQTLPVPLLAALAAMALGLLFYVSPVPFFHPGVDPHGTIPSGTRGTVAGGPLTSLLAEGAALPREGFVLRWSGPEGASFDIEVVASGGVLVDSAAGLGATEHRVAEEKLRELAPGTVLTWQVSARLAAEEGPRIETRKWHVRLE